MSEQRKHRILAVIIVTTLVLGGTIIATFSAPSNTDHHDEPIRTWGFE